VNLEREIEEGLRRRPSDERTYSEPLDLTAGDLLLRRGRMRRGEVTMSRTAVPALAGVGLSLALVVGAVVVTRTGAAPDGGHGQSGPAASQPGPTRYVDRTAVRIPDPGLVTCNDEGPVVSEEELWRVARSKSNAEQESDPAAAQLRSSLAAAASAAPTTGWTVLSRSADSVTYLKYDESWLHIYVATVTRTEAGWAGGKPEACAIKTVPPAGYDYVGWTIDESAPVARGSLDVQVLARLSDCEEGRTWAGQIAYSLSQDDDMTFLTIWVKEPATPVQEPSGCKKSDWTPVLIHLDKGVGDEQFYDGADNTDVAVRGRVPLLDDGASSPAPSPSPTPAGSAADPGLTPAPTPVATAWTYYVKSGDNLSMIATRLGVRLCEIRAANPGLDPNHIEVGQKIFVPAPGMVTCVAG
jgi:hypothetical protein